MKTVDFSRKMEYFAGAPAADECVQLAIGQERPSADAMSSRFGRISQEA
jgi:hypothetical protein